jgi:hypothetical protein
MDSDDTRPMPADDDNQHPQLDSGTGQDSTRRGLRQRLRGARPSARLGKATAIGAAGLIAGGLIGWGVTTGTSPDTVSYTAASTNGNSGQPNSSGQSSGSGQDGQGCPAMPSRNDQQGQSKQSNQNGRPCLRPAPAPPATAPAGPGCGPAAMPPAPRGTAPPMNKGHAQAPTPPSNAPAVPSAPPGSGK